MGRRWIVMLAVAAALLGATAYADGEGFAVSDGEDAARFSGSYSGRKTWTISYGFGDALALAADGLSPGSISLEQTLAVDVEARALGILLVEAHFDDQEEDSLQSLSIYLDTERLDGVAGDFIVPDMGSFSAYSRKLKGARLDYTWGMATITAIASKLEGVTASKFFTGETAEVTATFSTTDPDTGEAASYLLSFDGLASFVLVSLYVEEFSLVRMVLDLSSGLEGVLAAYGVGELGDALDGYEGKTLLSSEFSVIGDDPQHLVLRTAPATILRRTIKDAIALYNDMTDAGLEYPFSSGSEAETEFLEDVFAYTSVAVNEDQYGVTDANTHLHYDLGEADVVGESLEIEVNPDGSGYDWISKASWPNYGVVVYEDEGVLEIRLPEEITSNPVAALRVTYSYTVVGGAYNLGLSVVPGTERVTLNGRLLVRDIDYSIDYEIGYVILFTEIGSSDRLEIEYERYGSGTGGYARYFSGITADVPLPGLALDLYLLQATDDPGSAENPESVSTMPNRQLVAGVSAAIELPDTTADFEIGYVDDRFPYDDNERVPLPNRVNAIASGSDFVLVGSDVGFSVFSDGEWHSYDTSDGLAGRSVRAIAVSDEYAFLGTSGGLTVVRLDGISPFDHASGWTELRDDDGLPDSSVHALFLDGGTLYVGTDGGAACAAVAEMDDADAWTTLVGAEHGQVTALALVGDFLYVGTDDGLLTYNPATQVLSTVAGTTGSAVHALYAEEESVYAALERGLCEVVGGAELDWIARGEPVFAVGAFDGDLCYGTADGMVRASDGTVFHAGWTITALAVAADALWVGTEASAEYDLWVWSLGDAEAAYDAQAMEIAGANPYRYKDAAREEHTSTGWVMSGSFHHSDETLSLSGTVDRIQEGYRAIGTSSRSDDGGWTLDGSLALGSNADLRLSHSYEMADLTTNQRVSTLENDLSFSGSFGPTIALRLHHESEDGRRSVRGPETERFSYTLSVGDGLFGDTVRTSVDWQESFVWADAAELTRSAVLGSSVAVTVLPEWTSTLSWRRPVYMAGDDWSGSERVAWGIDGPATFAGVSVLTEYDGAWSRSLPGGDAAMTHAGRVRLAMDAVTWKGCKITPNLDLSGEWEDEALSFAGRLNLRTAWTALSGRTTLTVDVSDLGGDVEHWTEKVTSTWSYTGIATLRPTVTYSVTRKAAVYEQVGTEETTTHSLSGRATWNSEEGAMDTFAATFRCAYGGTTDLSATIENSYQRDVTAWLSGLMKPQSASEVVPMGPYPAVTAGTDVTVDWDYEDGASDARWTLAGDATILLSEMWSAAFTVSYDGGFTQSGTWYHGAWFALTVAIDF